MYLVKFKGFDPKQVETSVRFFDNEYDKARDYYLKMQEFLTEYGYDSESVLFVHED